MIINNVKFPPPDQGFEIIESTNVDAGRNTKGVVVGQKIGRNIWKLNNLQWTGLTVEQWTAMKKALSSFYIPVTFTDDTNTRRTITMYPGDRTSTPVKVSAKTLEYNKLQTCKFNLIDCGE